MSGLVTVVEHESFTQLSMDDGKANALGFDMLAALSAGLDVAETRAKPVVIAGRAGKFSAGFDLSVMARLDAETFRLLNEGAQTALRLMRFPTPVVLAVSGHALAMGALLCLSADYRIGAQGEFKLGLNEVAIGMTLPWFGVELARARLSETHLQAAVNLACIYGPDEAVSAGYLDEAVQAEDLIARAQAAAEQFASLNMPAYHATKLRTRAPFFERIEAALEQDFKAA